MIYGTGSIGFDAVKKHYPRPELLRLAKQGTNNNRRFILVRLGCRIRCSSRRGGLPNL